MKKCKHFCHQYQEPCCSQCHKPDMVGIQLGKFGWVQYTGNAEIYFSTDEVIKMIESLENFKEYTPKTDTFGNGWNECVKRLKEEILK